MLSPRLSCIFVFLILAAGCRRDSDPPPRLVSSDLGLMPLRASDVVVDTVLLASALTDEAARAGGAAAAPAAAPVPIDDTTPEALGQTYVAIINAGQFQQWATIVLPEQQAVATELAQVIQPAMEVFSQLQRVMGEKFPGHAFQPPLGSGPIPADWARRWTVAGVEVDAADANLATLKLQEENGTQTTERKLKKVDDHWRVEEVNVPTEIPPDLATGVTALTDALRAVIARIENNEITDPQQVVTAIVQAMAGSAAPADTATPAAEPPVETPAAPPADSVEPKKKPRERDAVDDTIAVPGILNRG